MTTDECKRILKHPIIDKAGLCHESDLTFPELCGILFKDREPNDTEVQKIEAYLSKWGVEWRDLIKEEL